MADAIVDFKCVPERLVYDSEHFKIYGCSVNSFEYPNIKINKYNNVTLKGDLTELNLGVEYSVKAKEVSDNRGVSYDVLNIKREKPTTLASARTFLSEILTDNQVETLLSVYPDIIDKVMNNRLDDIDLNKTKGIKEYTFNVIKNKIIENFKLADIVEEFKGLFSLSVIKKLYSKYTSLDKIKEVIRQEPYECLCSLGGVGFKTADSLLLKLNEEAKRCQQTGEKPILFFGYDLLSSYQRAKACIDYILTENENNGNTYLSVRELKCEVDTLVPEAKDNLFSVLKDDNDVIFDRELLSVSRKPTYEAEQYIAKRIKEALQINTKWDCDYTKFQDADGFKLTKEQCKTSEYLCNHNLVMLVGSAGTGKSSSTNALITMLKNYNKTFVLFAPTGKASKVISSYTGEKAMTIHRGLGFIPPNTWTYCEDSKLQCDVVIVDEFSMVDAALFKHLLEAIDFKKTKLLLIGDDAQIPSVGAGNLLFDMLQYNQVPTIKLKKVFRYGTGGLSTVATDIRLGTEYLKKEKNSIQPFGEDSSYVFMPIAQEKIVDYTVKLYQKLLNKEYTIEDITIISCYNVGNYGTVVLNKAIQDAINSNSESKITFGDKEFRQGDIVINRVNDYHAIRFNEECINEDNTTFIANGESGKVTKILKDGFVVNFDGELIYEPKSAMKNINLGYSISAHASQGSQCKVVIFLSPRAHTYFLNSNLMYVSITRAKENCYHLGEIKTVNTALKKKENFNRQTLLLNFLKDINDPFENVYI